MKKEIISHLHYDLAVSELRHAISNHRPGRIIGICGLAGSGKTFLRNQVIREVIGTPQNSAAGKTAVIEVMALLDTNSKFTSKAFAARAHRAILIPDLRAIYRDQSDAIQKEYMASLSEAEKAWKTTRSSRLITEGDYWLSFTEAAISRGLIFLLVEHATAIATLRTGEESPDHIQNLMSIVEVVGAMAILNYVPSGRKLWEGRPEVADRMDRIYIKPYDITDKAQLTEFGKLAVKIGARYKFESEKVIRDNIVDIGIATATTVRSVEELFERASVNALKSKRQAINVDDVMSAMDSEKHIAAIWDQVRILKEISQPATSEELKKIHHKYMYPIEETPS